MPFVQTSYSERMRAGILGAIVNMETQNSITRIAEEVAGIPFGAPVVQGVSDKGILLPLSTAYAAVGAAVAGNTGNGTITASPTVAAGVKPGKYLITITDAATNAGFFTVEDPDGVTVDVGTVGVAFTKGGLTFTVADGSTDFAQGDQFQITVTATAGGGQFKGISIRDTTLVTTAGQTADLYQKGDNVGVLKRGVIWGQAGAAIRASYPLSWDPTAKRYVERDTAGSFPLPNVSADIAASGNGVLFHVRVSDL